LAATRFLLDAVRIAVLIAGLCFGVWWFVVGWETLMVFGRLSAVEYYMIMGAWMTLLPTAVVALRKPRQAAYIELGNSLVTLVLILIAHKMPGAVLLSIPVGYCVVFSLILLLIYPAKHGRGTCQ